MRHTADSYLEAAQEQAEVARTLHQEQHFAAAHYWSGVAVECLLRAYRVRINPEFSSRHDLAGLVQSAHFYDFVPPQYAEATAANLQAVCARWNNAYRYCSSRAVGEELGRRNLDANVALDQQLEHSSGVIVSAAINLVELGVRRWNSGTS